MNKVRPIALMEIMLKPLERVLFTRIEKVVMDNSMLREEQYGGLRGRQVQDPIRILAELIEDANVSGKELHIISAGLSKTFHTLEYWSKAMSWSALGAPKQLVINVRYAAQCRLGRCSVVPAVSTAHCAALIQL
jgi:hypothetical protein